MQNSQEINNWLEFTKVIVPVIATLLGVIVGAGITSIIKLLELRHQQKQEKRKLILSKLEEIHELLSLYMTSSVSFISETKLISTEKKGEMFSADDLSKYKQLFIENLISPLKKIRAIVGIYIPEGRNDLENIRKLNAIIRDMSFNYLLEDGNYEDILVKQGELVEYCRKLQKKFEGISDKIMNK